MSRINTTFTTPERGQVIDVPEAADQVATPEDGSLADVETPERPTPNRPRRAAADSTDTKEQ